MTGEKTISDDGTKSPVAPTKDSYQFYIDTCVKWPNNMPGRATGDCCWQWIDDGN